MEFNSKKVTVWLGSILAGSYILFLILPLFLSPILDSYSSDIEDTLKAATGLEFNIDNISVVTAPNLSAGVKVKSLSVSLPASEKPFVQVNDAGLRLALLPVVFKNIQIDSVFAKDFSADIVVKEDGTFLVQDFLVSGQKSSQTPSSLPYGFKLSNKLPNVKSKSYKLSFVDEKTSNLYYVKGSDFKLTDFILDKKFKLSTKGKIVFENIVVSDYDVKIYNKIMPKLLLDDLVFPKDIVVDADSSQTNSVNFKIIDLFKSVCDNKLSANILADIKTFGTFKEPHLSGHLRVDALSVGVDGKKLPESYFDLIFKGNRTDIDSMFFTSNDEKETTQIIGDIHSGKKPSIDLTLRSNAKFNNIIKLVNSIAKSFGVYDFNTLSATGGIVADFNLASDLKKVSSTGYLKIIPSSLNYGLYNVSVDNIRADIDFTNNDINIKEAGFSILGHPLRLSGRIDSDSTADLNLTANQLSLKGLLAAIGQISLLKENDINSGEVSFNGVIKGKLSNIKPEITARVNGVNILNKASFTKLKLSEALLSILYDGKSALGSIDVNGLYLLHSGANVSVPDTNILIGNKDIDIKKSYIMLNNSRIDVKGSVKDYLSDRMNIDIAAEGNLGAVDAAAVLPKEFRDLITYKGKIPVKMSLTGNSKVQNIKLNITADKNNYLSLVDLKSLRNQVTNIHSNIEIIGDSLTFRNTGVSNDKNTVIKLSGGISKLYSAPQLNLNISVPAEESFPIWGLPNSNITANGSVSVVGDVIDPQLRGTVNLIDISSKDLDFKISDIVADLSGSVLNGEATARQFKFGGIVASDLTVDFSLKDYSKFYLSNITATAFDGKVRGNISYDISNSEIGLDMSGSGLNSTNAVEGAVGIKNALSGVLDFNAKLNMKGLTDKDIIQSMKGDVDFNVTDGRFISIGRLENLVAAQNVSSNSVLKAAISALSSLSTIQEADKFKYIKGSLTLGGGSANISNILVAGPLMSYHVHGGYNILPNTANLVILGRLEAKVVSCLGPLGELSADKLLAFIPKFGALTSNILKQLTADPANEDISVIPELTGGSTAYKDFKVVINGVVGASSSVRSFKWLSQCDTTQIDLKQELENAKETVKTNISDRVNDARENAQNVKTNVNNLIEAHKSRAEASRQNFAQAKQNFQTMKDNAKNNSENLKNLFMNAVQNSQRRVPEPSVNEATP